MTENTEGKNRKNLSIAKEEKKGDNKPKSKKGAKKDADPENIELTFSAESKEALETHPNARVALKKLQLMTLQFSKETQEVGNIMGLDLRARPIFDMRIKGS